MGHKHQKPTRGTAGRFQKGTAPGPGRPKGRKTTPLTNLDLIELAQADVAGKEYFTAMTLRTNPELTDNLDADFPPEIVARVRRLVRLADLAQQVLIARLERELANGSETAEKPSHAPIPPNS